MSLCCVRRFRIGRWSGGRLSEVEDAVLEEVPIEVYMNGRLVSRLHALPLDLEELGVGYVVSEGLARPEGILSWRSGELRVEVEAEAAGNARPSGLRSSSPLGGPRLSPNAIGRISKVLTEGTELHRLTGATHLAGAFHPSGESICLFEDVGRHNAVDKVIGRIVIDRIPAEEVVLALSGRLTVGITTKAARAGVGVLISKSAPSSASVEAARRLGMTLIGFARGARFNVYSGLDRLDLSPRP